MRDAKFEELKEIEQLGGLGGVRAGRRHTGETACARVSVLKGELAGLGVGR